jgi:hypothetical protein
VPVGIVLWQFRHTGEPVLPELTAGAALEAELAVAFLVAGILVLATGFAAGTVLLTGILRVGNAGAMLLVPGPFGP